ncbi:MAG: DNA polymerase IV [Planctomycetota bacterium]|nr:DNA polymerase IV [Planctomycetota bacterium]MDP6762125.1 DNA polymerase IV [Planctomycetota bacterium]
MSASPSSIDLDRAPGASPPSPRRILHLDVDAFLASVEQAVHPELRGRPLVIGGLPDERNLVMSCTYDVRARGVRPGMLLAEAARRCPEALFRRGDAQAANRLRRAVARVALRTSPLVEEASIDDFFVDLTGCTRLCGPAFATAERLRAQVRAEVGLPLSVGVGTNRTLARLAGMLAKPGGVAEVLPGYERHFLRALPVHYLPGVGRTTRRLFEQFAVRTAGDLAQASREVLFASFGSAGLVLHDRARGIDPDPVEATYELCDGDEGLLRVRMPRSIQRVSTFEPEEGRRERVEAMLCYLVERAGHRLRSHGLRAGSAEVSVTYVDTRPPAVRRRARAAGEGGHHRRRRAFEHPENATDALWSHARALLRSLPRRRALTRRIGLSLFGLSPGAGWQGSLFSAPRSDLGGDGGGGARGSRRDRGVGGGGGARGSRRDRHRRLDRALDDLRGRLGFGRVLRGGSFPLTETCELEADGFRLRTPSLNQ